MKKSYIKIVNFFRGTFYKVTYFLAFLELCSLLSESKSANFKHLRKRMRTLTSSNGRGSFVFIKCRFC